MKTHIFIRMVLGTLTALVSAGCATNPPYDYTNFRAHPPRSILVVPPLNDSTDVRGTYGYLSTVTFPLAELGYYVFPVQVVDDFLKENGLPTAGEMNQVPAAKFGQIFGADAVLYATLEQYGSKYQVINSSTTVKVKAQLMDTKTGVVLWAGEAFAQENSGGSGNPFVDLIAAALTQAINSGTDQAHNVSRMANYNLFYTKDHGLLYGPYHLQYGQPN